MACLKDQPYRFLIGVARFSRFLIAIYKLKPIHIY